MKRNDDFIAYSNDEFIFRHSKISEIKSNCFVHENIHPAAHSLRRQMVSQSRSSPLAALTLLEAVLRMSRWIVTETNRPVSSTIPGLK